MKQRKLWKVRSFLGVWILPASIAVGMLATAIWLGAQGRYMMGVWAIVGFAVEVMLTVMAWQWRPAAFSWVSDLRAALDNLSKIPDKTKTKP